MSEAPEPNVEDEVWWCNTHQRRADYVDAETKKHVCDPKLPGTLMVCRCVNIANIAKIEDERSHT